MSIVPVRCHGLSLQTCCSMRFLPARCQTPLACLASASFCACAVLATLRAYEARFLRLASARFESGSGLRAPNASECEQADKRFWECVSELRVQGWCLDDAIHEHTAVRSELSALLSPRPFVPKAGKRLDSKGHPSGKGKAHVSNTGRGTGKGRGGGKGRGFGRGRGGTTQTQAQSAKQEWVSSAKVDGEVKTLCVRYSQRTGCKNPSCRFAHLCPVKLPSGRICLGAHPAWQHQDTPH